MENKYGISVTAIIFNPDNQVLLVRRNSDLAKWPGKWTVPGGKVTDQDFIGKPTLINNQWYHTLERAVEREVKEETNLSINNIKYLCNIAIPGCFIISYVADLSPEEYLGIPKLQEEELQNYAWINRDQLYLYDLIDGIAQEIEEAYVFRGSANYPLLRQSN